MDLGTSDLQMVNFPSILMIVYRKVSDFSSNGGLNQRKSIGMFCFVSIKHADISTHSFGHLLVITYNWLFVWDYTFYILYIYIYI